MALLTLPGIHAQEVTTDSIIGNAESEKAVSAMQQEAENATDTAVVDEKEKRMKNVWKRYSKYNYLAYGMQTLKSSSKSIDSDYAFTYLYGRTYYLHKKPIAGLIKFGIDWNFIDVNFAQYPDFPAVSSGTTETDTEQADYSMMQIEYGMGIGPSVTVNPVSHLKVCAYFHVTPSYSLIIQNGELYSNYATFFNVGLTVAYKKISIGIENRWCGYTDCGNVKLSRPENMYDKDGNFIDPFAFYGAKVKTNTLRLFIGYRF